MTANCTGRWRRQPRREERTAISGKVVPTWLLHRRSTQRRLYTPPRTHGHASNLTCDIFPWMNASHGERGLHNKPAILAHCARIKLRVPPTLRPQRQTAQMLVSRRRGHALCMGVIAHNIPRETQRRRTDEGVFTRATPRRSEALDMHCVVVAVGRLTPESALPLRCYKGS